MNRKLKMPLAGLLMVGLVLTGGFSYLLTTKVAYAGVVTSFKDVLSDSAPSAAANHTVTFTTESGVDAAETIIITWDSDFDATTDLDYTDVDVKDDAAELTLAAAASGATWGVGFAGDAMTLTSDSGTIGAGSVIEVQIGTHATEGTTGDQQIDSPAKVAAVGTADIYDVTISGTFGDTGTTKIAIIEGVTVSVTIESSLSFNIAPVASGSCTGDTGSPTAINTTTTTVPFGTVVAENFYTGCQTLSAGTNAVGGYSITGVTDTSLKYGTTLIDSGVCDADCTASVGDTWATNTLNGLAYFCDGANDVGDACVAAGDTTGEYRRFACAGADADCDPTDSESPVEILASSAPASGDSGTIHYKLSVDAAQAAGTYSNTVTYVATPTF